MAGTDGTSETVPRQWLRAGIFDVLGIKPVVGRTFEPEDDRQLARVVVLSEVFWRARFGADPSVIGTDAVRRALGATTREVLRLVVWSALEVIGAGVAAGLGLAAVLGRPEVGIRTLVRSGRCPR